MSTSEPKFQERMIPSLPNRRQRRIDAGINKRGLHNSTNKDLLIVGRNSKHVLSTQLVTHVMGIRLQKPKKIVHMILK